MNAETIISKVWSFCTTLRDDGVGYGDYLEQLTYLIFLKMADEYSRPPYNRDVGIPEKYNWNSLRSKKGAELEGHYITLLRELANKQGMLGQIFTKSQNKIQDPAKLSRLVEIKLADFGIEVEVVAVTPGPVITRFELQLAAGIKVSRISNLSKDLARALSTVSVRIVEVIAGKRKRL